MSRRTLLAGLAMATVTFAQAVPSVPAHDHEVVQHLPARLDRAARAQRAALERDPAQLPLALATARAALERARLSGDPRELGAAQAALAPWWTQAAPPHAVRLLRATIRQSQHAFDDALGDLDALVDDPATPPAVLAQAGLTRATVLQVTGRLDDARRACEALTGERYATLGVALSVPALACVAELRSLQGEAPRAARELAALAREAPGDRWLALVRAELAQRQGDHAAAQERFRDATAAAPTIYALAARADWLLERGRAREALQSLDAGDPEADALLLRRALALKALGDPRAGEVARTLAGRFAAARERGDALHLREQARLALDLQDDPARALPLAQANWQQQKEPADALLLARAAAAAGQGAAAQPLRRLLDSGWTDVRLARALESQR